MSELLPKGFDYKNAFYGVGGAITFRVKQSTLENYSGKANNHILSEFGSVRADKLDAFSCPTVYSGQTKQRSVTKLCNEHPEYVPVSKIKIGFT